MLTKISENVFEVMGTVVGVLASLSIATQIHAEALARTPSTLSTLYASGVLFIFVFWTVYGLRFKRPALWITNGLAALMQIVLLVVIQSK